jgi:hypothetical protein
MWKCLEQESVELIKRFLFGNISTLANSFRLKRTFARPSCIPQPASKVPPWWRRAQSPTAMKSTTCCQSRNDESPSLDESRSSSDCDPSTKDQFELPASKPQDRPATKNGEPCAHYRRELPLICHKTSAALTSRFVKSAPESMYFVGQSILEEWLKKRAKGDYRGIELFRSG